MYAIVGVVGGCVDVNSGKGVINDKCQVHGDTKIYVRDDSVVSVNSGANPSLSITAISEWAMSHIPEKCADVL